MNLGVESGDIGILMTSRFDDWTVQGPSKAFQERGYTDLPSLLLEDPTIVK